MPRVNLWFKFLVVVSAIVIGTALVRSFTGMLHDMVHAGTPHSQPIR
jgi:hypothetical protein